MSKKGAADKRKAKKRKERERRIRRETNLRRNNERLPEIEDLPGDDREPELDPPFATERLFRKMRDMTGEPEEAQELAFRSMEARSRGEAERFARAALTLDPDCVDALAVLAALRPTPGERLAGLAEALATAERALGGREFMDENAGRFWGLVETRPYMRTRAALAGALREHGRLDEAAVHYRAMLELNPGDNQGVRYDFVALALQRGDAAAARACLLDFADEGTAVLAWAEVLERFQSGDRRGAAAALRRARARNEHAEAGLLGVRRARPRADSFLVGHESEGLFIADLFAPAWAAHPAARAWLGEGGPATTEAERAEARASYGPPVDALLALGWVEFGAEWRPPAAFADLGPEDVGELVRMATDPALSELPEDSDEVWAPIHAVRALGHLGALAAMEPLVGLLDEDLEDDWLLCAIPAAFVSMGLDGVPTLARVLHDSAATLLARETATEVLAELSRRHPDRRSACLDPLVDQLRRYRENDPILNSSLIWDLAAARDDRHLDLMKEVFDSGRVDEDFQGTWEAALAAARGPE